jgi:hypothetical protein
MIFKKSAKKAATLEERREEVLAKGRRFRYPVQYAKHRIVINTVLIGLGVLLLAGGLLYLALYQWQDTGDIMFRIAKVLPVPVANVDGQDVRYSDYLMIYRSSIAPVEQQNGKLDSSTDDGRFLIRHYKRSAMDDAESYALAMKFAEELGIAISREQVAEAVREYRMVGGVERSEESFNKIIRDNFGLSRAEYERLVVLSLMRKEVSARVDTEAGVTAEEVARLIGEGEEFREIAEQLGEAVIFEDSGGLVDNMNLDGGRAAVAAKMADGEASEMFISKNGDGYYFVKTVRKTETAVEYVSIRVPFREFSSILLSLREEGKIKEYISLESE